MGFVVFFTAKDLAGNIIIILHGTSDRTNPSFFDSSCYFTKPGKTVKWYNTDDVSHNLILTGAKGNSNYAATRQIAESGIIPPNGNSSYNLDNYVMYEHSSPNYPWMKGAISVSDDTNTTIVSQNMKNNVNIELTQQPFKAKVGRDTFFD